MTRMKRWAIPAVCILLPVLVLSACGTKKVKGSEAAAQVKSKVLQPRGITDATVKCPAETEAKEGAKEKCTVTGTFDKDGNLGDFQSDVKDVQIAVIEEKAAEEASGKGVDEVDCGEGVEPKDGAVFFCTANIENSGRGVVLVRQTSEASEVAVTVRRRRLTTQKIEGNIKKELQKRGINANVDCPGKVVSQKGSTFRCKVTNPANGKQITIKATQVDDEGNFNLKVE